MVSIGKLKADLQHLSSNGALDKPVTVKAINSSEPEGNMPLLMDYSGNLVDPYLLRRNGKYLICLAIENMKYGSIIL